MRSRSEKGGGGFAGIKLLLCENPLPPIEEAIATLEHEAKIRARAAQLREWIKPLGDARLGPGYMRITTALPEDNARFLAALREFL